MYPIWFLDHFFLVTLLIIAVAIGAVFVIYQYSLRVSEQHPAKTQLAAFGVQLTTVVLITFFLNNLYGAVRDREQRQWDLRQNHLVKLQTVLRVDSEKLTSVSRQARNVGRITGFSNGLATDMAELELYFSPDLLTPDLANHYQEYWQEKQELLKDVQRQDGEFGDTVGRVSKSLQLPSYAESRRTELGQNYLQKCLGKGPGFTLTVRDEGYSYTTLGGGGSNSGGHPPQDLTGAAKAFQSISPDSETIKHCEALMKGATSIAAKATELALMANRLAERTVLAGNCEYTKLD